MTLDEIYEKGQQILNSKALGFNLRGVETEFVLRHNREAFDRFVFLQRAIGSAEACTDTKLLDVPLAMPIVMSSISTPIPQIREDGLMKVAIALKDVGSMMWTGSPLPSNLAELVKVGVPLAQTFKPLRDRKRLLNMISQAVDADVTWLGIEIDAGQGTKILGREIATDCAPLSVDELTEVKQRAAKPLVVKGVLSPWDAEKALEAGADLIMVSNHGAHTIDYLPHPFDVMDEITHVVAGKVPIIVDGGFRNGTDVLKALALGASAVGVGRPILYGLAADGEDGVRDVMTGIAQGLKRVMTMTGVPNPRSASREILLRLA